MVEITGNGNTALALPTNKCKRQPSEQLKQGHYDFCQRCMTYRVTQIRENAATILGGYSLN